MKLQRTFSCIAGVFFAVSLAASQAVAGSGVPGCGTIGGGGDPDVGFMEIEVNQMRAGGKTIVTSPNDTTKVTAKARIAKGSAESGTTIVTVLAIDTVVDGIVVSTASQGGITLGVGKGGKGASLLLATESCGSNGVIEFHATFTGLDGDTDTCVGERILKKECR